MTTRKSEIQTVLTADTSNLVRGMNRGKSEAEKYKGVMDRLTGSFKSALGGLGVGLSAGALTAGLASAVRSTMDFAEQIENMSASTGVGAEAIQALSTSAKNSGLEISFLQAQLVKLNEMVNTEAGQKELTKLGIKATSVEDAISQLANSFGGAGSSGIAELTGVMGDKFAKLLPVLKEIKDAGGLGGLVGGMKAEGLLIANEDIKRLQEADKIVDGIKNKLTVEIAEGISYWMNLLKTDEPSTKDVSTLRNLMDMKKLSLAMIGGENWKAPSKSDVDFSMNKAEFMESQTVKYVDAAFQNVKALDRAIEMLNLEQDKTRYGLTDDARYWGEGRGMTNAADIRESYAKHIDEQIKTVMNARALYANSLGVGGENMNEDMLRARVFPKILKAYNEAEAARVAGVQKILEARQKEILLGEDVIAIQKQISELESGFSNDIVRNTEIAFKISKLQDQLAEKHAEKERKIADEKLEADLAALDNAEKLAKKMDEKATLSKELSELESDRADILSGKGQFRGIDVDEYAKVGKIVGVNNIMNKTSEQYAKESANALKSIDKNIAEVKDKIGVYQ